MELTASELQQHNHSPQAGQGWAIEMTTRHTILYSSAVVLLSAAVCYLFAAMELKTQPSAAALCLFAIVFWLIGLAHIFIFPPLLKLLHSTNGLLFSAGLSILVIVSALALFYITGFEMKQLAIAAGAAFLLPHLLEECIDHYFSVPPPAQYPGWVIPAGATADKRMSLLLNSIYFRIKIKVAEDDMDAAIFTVTLPDKLTLSAVFLRFLYDQHNAIAITDGKLQPCKWHFSVTRRFGKIKMLNPEKTLKENGVKEDEVIFIERA